MPIGSEENLVTIITVNIFFLWDIFTDILVDRSINKYSYQAAKLKVTKSNHIWKV